MRKASGLWVFVVVLGCLSAAIPAGAAESRAVIADSHPAWAMPQTKVADAEADGKMTFRVYLRPRDVAGAERTARAVSDPASPTFRQYLTPEQVRGRYAPARESVALARDWLSANGFAVGDVPVNNLYVPATGTVSQVQRAFDVRLGVYAVKGNKLRAPDGDLSVPARLSTVVGGVIGVDQALRLMTPHHTGTREDTSTTGRAAPTVTPPATGRAAPAVVPPAAGFRNARPCSAYWAEKTDTTDPAFGGKHLPYAPCGYKPEQLRSAYGIDQAVKAGIDGRGQTVAIVDAFASPTIFADASTYARRNDPAYPLKVSQFKEIVFPANPELEGPGQCDAAGWYGEETLDVEAVHAMAPGANILYVGGSDCENISLDVAVNEIVANNLAQIISNSYGNTGEDIPAAEIEAFESIVIQAALQGIGVYFSSGDNGDEVGRLGHPETDFPASSPWITAVGGTSLGIGADGRRVLETGWETGRSTLTDGAWDPAAPGSYLYGSGGGTSRTFAQPFYQRGVVPDALAAHNQVEGTRGRVVPDLSMLGDPNTGMLIGGTQTFPEGAHYDEYRIGGTSLASPLLAGVMALSDQLKHTRHGFINPWLYQVTSHTAAITDVTHVPGGVIRVDYVSGIDGTAGFRTTARSFDYPDLTIHTTPGYDDVTGLGIPNGWAFLAIA